MLAGLGLITVDEQACQGCCSWPCWLFNLALQWSTWAELCLIAGIVISLLLQQQHGSGAHMSMDGWWIVQTAQHTVLVAATR